MRNFVKVIALSAILVTPIWAFAGSGLPGYQIGVKENVKGLERVTQTLVKPPLVPKHQQTAGSKPKVVQVRMVIEEKEVEIAPGVFTHLMTFNGHVPGPLIVVHQGDYVELTLVNPKTSTLLHNIDFHASTGALGGGELTKVAPGQEVVFRFKATKAGTFVYHCAPGGIMVPWHVAQGMNGAIMVLPRDGLKDENGKSIKYDLAYYIGEQDYYIPKDSSGKYKRYPSPAASLGDTLKTMEDLTPSHIVFNGVKGALLGENALKAKVGDTMLLIHSQANRHTFPHLIGGHANYVWPDGDLHAKPKTDLESWNIPAGATGAMMYTFLQPGLYAYLNHNLIEAFIKGAVAHIKVDGKWNNDLMTQVKAPTAIK